MFYLKKVTEAFILPPGIFIVVFIFAGLVQFLRKKRLMGVSIWLLSLTVWVMSTTPFTDSIMRHLESGITIPTHPKGDLIVILGAGINRSIPDISGMGSPTETTTHRLFTAARLQKQLHVPILFSGAGDSADPQPVKGIVVRILKEMGVPKGMTLIEDQSRDTRESAVHVARICKEKEFKRPILVSSAYHLKRSVYCFNQAGLQVTPFPAGFETWQGKRYAWPAYLPGDFRRFSMALKEIMGLKFYQLLDKF